MEELTEEEIAFLYRFARFHGRYWKSKLCRLWAQGEEFRYVDSGISRRIRNKVGPEGLYKIRLEGL